MAGIPRLLPPQGDEQVRRQGCLRRVRPQVRLLLREPADQRPDRLAPRNPVSVHEAQRLRLFRLVVLTGKSEMG